jgi:hypothetical protein
MDANIQTIRQVVNADVLARYFPLPATFTNHKIEIVMRPLVDEETTSLTDKINKVCAKIDSIESLQLQTTSLEQWRALTKNDTW